MQTTLVVVSDTHGKLSDINVPDGDVLIHCGDFCKFGNLAEFDQFCAELAAFPHRHKIVIAGNHDYMMVASDRPATERKLRLSATYLRDEGIVIEGLNFFGVAWRGRSIFRDGPSVWDTIPIKTDVLVTHNPPLGIMDTAANGSHIGSEELRTNITRVKPLVHCFGHVHCSYGNHKQGGTLFVNAANADESYRPAHPATVVRITDGVAEVVAPNYSLG